VEAKIEVEDEEEAVLIRRALSDPQTRVLVKVMGALLALPTDRARRRALTFVSDHLAERNTA
jgi:hypothetical protein